MNGIHLTRIQTDQNPENVKYAPKSKFLPPTQQTAIPLEKNAQNRPRNNFQEIPYQLDTHTDTEQNSPYRDMFDDGNKQIIILQGT